MPESHLKFHAANGKRQILVVEDEPINQEILRMILQDSYDLRVAQSGAEALEIVSANSATISLILLDLNLPDMHGLEVLRRIKAAPESARLPVIVMTAEKDAEVESLALGATDFIPKPYPQPRVVQARVLRTIELSEDRDILRWTERDQLTGLYNREFFYRYAVQLDLFQKELPTDAVVLDINHFHMLNERHGKSYGDRVLKRLAGNVRAAVQEAGGIACRREADTFLLYLPHREDYAAFLERLSVPGDEERQENPVRLRMGVYAHADKAIDIERRFDRAKMAADKVKGSFTRTIGVYDESMHQAEVLAEQLIDDFQTAIREKQFQIYYQPKFDVRPEEPVLCSAEALIRWHHPQLGMISPGVFIPLFEKNGLIQQLDSFVWREAAAQVKAWKESLGIALPVSLNVSRIDLYDPDLVEKIQKLTEENGLSESELLLEITESAYTEDSSQIIEKVKELRGKGFRVEMDDFGSGYSSLNMLSTLPIDALKLDMQFIRNAFRERKDTRLLEAVIRLAESLGVSTIAEGVETAEQMLTLKNMGCDIVQGYYFSRPLPAEDFARFVADKKQDALQLQKAGKKSQRDSFTYEALHDPLTGVYNHTAFDILFRDSDPDHIAVLVADVDDYAAIKGEKGRAYGDRVIRRVADVLRGNFRSVDAICRLREDEFVVIMTRVTRAMHDQVFEKVELVNRILCQGDGELMPLSLSVGVAFSDRDKPQGDIFQDADTALNRMKEVRKRGCAVF